MSGESHSVKAHAEAPAARRVLLVAPLPPPYGGMALQARKLEKLLRAEGHAVTFVPANYPLSGLLRAFERLPALRTAAKSVAIWRALWRLTPAVEIVHVFAASWLYFFLVVWPAVFVGRRCGKRVVLNYRGGAGRRFFRACGWLVRPVFKRATVVTAPSRFLGEAISSRFGVEVSIVPNILDSESFPYREREAIRPRLLVTRHLEAIYDNETALKAFRAVQERYPDATLWIAGTGSEEARLRELVAAWGLKGVRFLGHVSHQDLPAIYDQCDILLNASQVDNFPGSLLEGAAAGLVVVSTCAGGIPAIFRNGRDALLVEPGDWEGLAAAVRKVLESQSLAAKLTRSASELTRACHWSEVRRRLYEAYGISPAEGLSPRPRPAQPEERRSCQTAI